MIRILSSRLFSVRFTPFVRYFAYKGTSSEDANLSDVSDIEADKDWYEIRWTCKIVMKFFLRYHVYYQVLRNITMDLLMKYLQIW